jgi:hypothetical protein
VSGAGYTSIVHYLITADFWSVQRPLAPGQQPKLRDELLNSDYLLNLFVIQYAANDCV